VKHQSPDTVSKRSRAQIPVLLLHLACAACVAWLAPAGASAQEYHDPAIEYAGFQIHPDLEVTLFAHEPMLANPIQMAWDNQGRLWVICSYAYPQLLPGQDPPDKIIVLEDTTGDNVADKRTVFADGLLVPTGFELGDGGVYVANQPDLLFLKDTTGDGVADHREVVLSGFGTEDNHHAISAWRWSPGGLLSFMSGIFLHTQVETPHGLVRLVDGGVFDWRPRTLELGIQSQANEYLNPWGNAFDRWGQSFLTEGPAGNIFHLSVAAHGVRLNRPFPKMDGAPKSCGIEFISGDHWPEDWQGDLILNAFRNRQVLRYTFSDDSSSFAAREVEPIITSTEEFFRPVDVKLGPDGALYIADWYNPIIGHMQYNFRDPRRDQAHGRIWRVTYKGRDLETWPKMHQMHIEDLLDLLKSNRDNVRHQARRTLYDRVPEYVAAATLEWVEALDTAAEDYEHHRLEALWTLQTVDQLDEDLLKAVLESPDFRARAAAVRVVRESAGRLEDPLALLAPRIGDEHPRPRLEAVVALSRIPDVRAMELAAEALDQPMDRYLEYALHGAAQALQPQWLAALEGGEELFGGNPAHLEFVLSAAPAGAVTGPLLALVKGDAIPAARKGQLLKLAARLASNQELREIFAQFAADTNPLQAVALEAVAAAIGENKAALRVSADTLEALIGDDDPEVRRAAIGLVGALQEDSLRDVVRDAAVGDTPEVAVAAVNALAAFGDQQSVNSLNRLARDGEYAHQVQAIAALAGVDAARAAPAAVAVLETLDGDDPAPLLTPFLQRREGADALAQALDGSAIGQDTARLALRYLQSVGRQDEALNDFLATAAGTGERFVLDDEVMAELMVEVGELGDPFRGEQVYRRLDCYQCHAIAGAGGHLGPDLNGLGISSQLDYIIESLLDPAAAIREGYEGVSVTTADWELFTGIKLRESDTHLTIRDAIRDEIVIAKADIDEIEDAGSLMPDGLLDLSTRQEITDLVAFIMELGRPGPFMTPNEPVVRRWRALQPIPGTEGAAIDDPVAALAMGPDRAPAGTLWMPAYSLVSGDLHLEEYRYGPDDARVFLIAEFEATTPGSIAFVTDDAEGLSLYLNGENAVAADGDTFTFEADRGIHRLGLVVDLEARTPSSLRLTFVEEETGGRARLIGGR